MTEILLRPALLEDLDTLLEFEQGVISAERPFEPTLKAGHINYYDIRQMIQSEDIELLVALIEDEIVGSGYARIEKAKPFQNHDYYAYLGFMYVKPEYRGRGINQKILEALILWARSKNIDEIRLDVFHNNLPAIRAYEKAGFKKLSVKMRLDAGDETSPL